MVGLNGTLVLIGILVVALISAVVLWVQGAAYNKQQDSIEQELKDWDVTVADGLDELEKQEKDV
jgi:hypothetical protein